MVWFRYPVQWLSLLLLLILTLSYGSILVLAKSTEAPALQSSWWDPERPYRVSMIVDASGTTRQDKIAEYSMNLTQLLAAQNQSGTIDLNSFQVIEVNAGGNVIDNNVPHQFDPTIGYNATTHAAGTIIFQLTGTTAANTTRYYYLYFDLAGKSYTAPSYTPQLTLVDDVMDEGLSSYQISTATTTYLYQKKAAGFSSLLDRNGNDWINHHPTGGAGGNFRGIPNLVYPEGKFHPGDKSSTSTIRSIGPLKITIHSATNDGKWEALWEFYPTYARMLLLKVEHSYWFLYEGTPGGTFDPTSDFVVRSNGSKTSATASWTADLAGPEWVYFADPAADRSLFVANHAEDNATDSYYAMSQAAGSMTVFGFGRQGTRTLMERAPATFTIGLIDTVEYDPATATINAAYHDLSLSLGLLEIFGGPPPSTLTPTATPLPTEVPTATPTATPDGNTVYLSSTSGGRLNDADRTRFDDEDIVAYSPATNSWSIFFDGTDVGLRKVDVDGFAFGPNGELLMSFHAPITIPDLGKVDDSDIVEFIPNQLGDNTIGTFRLFMDGSTRDLTSGGEDVDAIAFDAAGRLIISTNGTARIGNERYRDEDLLVWTGTTWERYLTGGDLALSAGSEDIAALDIDGTTLYLSTVNKFKATSLNDLSGDGDDIIICASETGNESLACTFHLYFDGDVSGFRNESIDALAMRGPQLSAAATANQLVVDETAVIDYEVDLSEEELDLADEDMDAFDLEEDESNADDDGATNDPDGTNKVWIPSVLR